MFWVLNLAIECPAPLDWIIPTYADTGFNIPDCPTLQLEQREELVRQLVADGFLVLFSGQSSLPRDYACAVIQSKLTGAKTDRYDLGITPAGAVLWEEWAKPSWVDFVRVESDYETGAIASASLDKVVAYLGWFGTLNPEEEILPGTITLSVRDRYPVTYWKELDHVYEAVFECRHRVEGSVPADASAWLKAWRAGLKDWRIRPWEMEGWPGRGGQPE